LLSVWSNKHGTPSLVSDQMILRSSSQESKGD
jgi:hypothetical protein